MRFPTSMLKDKIYNVDNKYSPLGDILIKLP